MIQVLIGPNVNNSKTHHSCLHVRYRRSGGFRQSGVHILINKNTAIPTLERVPFEHHDQAVRHPSSGKIIVLEDGEATLESKF